MLRARDITLFLHNRYGVAFFMLFAVAAVIYALTAGIVTPLQGDYGLVVTSPNNWLQSGTASTALSIVMNIAVALSAIYLNKQYNTMRSLSMLVASVFMVMQLASPAVLGLFNGSGVLAVGLSLITMLLFSVFSDVSSTRRMFLIFFLLASFSLFEYSFLFYVPIILFGFSQMRIMNFRSFLAAIIGFITPLWILLGFGIITLEDIRFPLFKSFLDAINTPGMWYQLLIIGVTIILGITFLTMNVIKMMSYNSRIRAANGFLTVLMLSTIIFIFIDYNNIYVYISLLNILVAYQIGHYFAIHIQSNRSYIGILSVLVIYLGLFIGRFL